MVGDEDADVAVFQAPDDMLDVLHGDGVDTGERLVEHDELRLDGQTAGYLRTAPLTTAELVAEVLAHLAETELLDKLLQLLLLVLPGLAGHLEDTEDVILDAHLTEDGGLLG